jgi:CrcB protein
LRNFIPRYTNAFIMLNVLIVGCGGFVGAVLRFIISTRVSQSLGGGFPWGTFFVNLTGCLLIGFLSGLFMVRSFHPSAGLLMITGVLGGFTTFSAFGLETLTLINADRPFAALLYVASSVVVGVFAVWLGRFPFAG